MKFPLILVNYKTYSQSIGRKGLELAKQMEKTSQHFAVAPQFPDLRLIAERVSIPVYAQHLDPVKPGSHTGHLLAEEIKDTGCQATLLNHSERRLDLHTIAKTIKRAHEAGLEVLCCAQDPGEGADMAGLDEPPEAIAVEPPELIGSGVSVSTAQPELLEQAVQEISLPVLCGAGITTGEDVDKALELGMKGVLLASGLVKADQPREVMKDLVKHLPGKE